MNTSTKLNQGQLWSIAPDYWSKHFEPYFIPMYKHVLAQLNLSEDSLLLDAGCGAGLFANMAIETGAQVTGIDTAPGMLEVARKRNPQNTFLEEDLEQLPFEDNSFHFVTGFNSFQYAGDFKNALLEAKRVLNTGGRLVIGIWDKPELNDATAILKSISSLLPPPLPGTPGPFTFSEDGTIEEICSAIGLKMLSQTMVACPILYHGIEAGIKGFMGTGPAASALYCNDRKIVEEAIARALRSFRITKDFYFLQNQFLVFTLEK